MIGNMHFKNSKLLIHQSSIDSAHISERYRDAVAELVEDLSGANISNIGAGKEDLVHRLLIVLSNLLHEDFSLEDFVRNDYINLSPELKVFFGNPFWLKFNLKCVCQKMLPILNARLIYLINALSVALNKQEFADEGFIGNASPAIFRSKFTPVFQGLILALAARGFCKFKFVSLCGLDLSGQTFKHVDLYGVGFKDCILNGTRFMGCNLDWASFSTNNQISNMIIDEYSSLAFTCFHSRLDLLDLKIFADTNKLRYENQLNKAEYKILLDINGYIKSSLEQINTDRVQKFSEKLRNYEQDEIEFEMGGATYRVLLECPIRLTKIFDLADTCAVKYANNDGDSFTIRVYSADALIEWLKTKRECPFRMKLNYVKNNLLNLEDLEKLLWQ